MSGGRITLPASFTEPVESLLSNRWRELLVLAAAVVLVIPFTMAPSRLYLLTLAFVYALLAISAIVPIGYSGQLIISQSAFFGIGAYTFIKLAEVGVPSWVAVLFATAFTMIVAYLLGRPAIRATGIYLAIITLAFVEMFVIVIDLFPNALGGSAGLASPDLYFPAVVADAIPMDILYFYIIVAIYAGVYLLSKRVLTSEHGLALRALHEEVIVAQSIGINTQRYRLFAFAATGAIGGLAGSVYAPMTGYIAPSLFDLHTSVIIILAGVVGGITVLGGSLIGGLFVIFTPELLKSVTEVRFIVYGFILIALLIFLPDGIGGWLKEQFE